MSVIQGARQLVGSMMRSGLDEAAFRLGGKKSQAPQRLGKRDMVKLYLRLGKQDRERVLQERGPEEFGNYERAMLKLLEEGY